MARHLRVEYPGAIYHVTARMLGDWKREENLLFEDDDDRWRFLDRLGERVEQYRIRLYLYVLMSNHFHLVFETPDGNCSAFMQSLTTAYTVFFNLRHQRHGHLMDGRYKARLVEGDEYLLKLSRYVHANPVCVSGVKDGDIKERIKYLRSYLWSSYPSYIGRVKRKEFITYEPVLALMEGRQTGWGRRYRTFVETGLAQSDDEMKEAMNISPRCIGSEAFREWVDRKHEELVVKHKHPEDVSFRKMARRLDPERILNVLSDEFRVPIEAFRKRKRGSVLRGVGARCLCRYAGLTQRAAAGVLEIGSGAAISHQLRNLAVREKTDKKLVRRINKAATRIEALRLPSSGAYAKY